MLAEHARCDNHALSELLARSLKLPVAPKFIHRSILFPFSGYVPSRDREWWNPAHAYTHIKTHMHRHTKITRNYATQKSHSSCDSISFSIIRQNSMNVTHIITSLIALFCLRDFPFSHSHCRHDLQFLSQNPSIKSKLKLPAYF